MNRVLCAQVEGDDWLVAGAYEHDVAAQADGRHAIAGSGRWIVDLLRAGERLVVRDLGDGDGCRRAGDPLPGVAGSHRRAQTATRSPASTSCEQSMAWRMQSSMSM